MGTIIVKKVHIPITGCIKGDRALLRFREAGDAWLRAIVGRFATGL